MEEKVYRQRRNLMITCIGIILFYMGPGDFNEIGLLKNLGLHTLEAWQLKAMILVMYLYYAWRYYQYSRATPSAISSAITEYITKEIPEKYHAWLFSSIKDEYEDIRKMSSRKDIFLAHQIATPIIKGPLAPWVIYFKTGMPKENGKDVFLSPSNGLLDYGSVITGSGAIRFKAHCIYQVSFHGTAFTDWIMPWLFFWLTWGIIVWNEFICTAWQMAAM